LHNRAGFSRSSGAGPRGRRGHTQGRASGQGTSAVVLVTLVIATLAAGVTPAAADHTDPNQPLSPITGTQSSRLGDLALLGLALVALPAAAWAGRRRRVFGRLGWSMVFKP
jgi:hypothetical protein